MHTDSVLDLIRTRMESLRPSERRVGQTLLEEPSSCVHDSIGVLAQRAGVSEPTVVRFCTALGFEGYRQFKVYLAQTLAIGAPYVHQAISEHDTGAALVDKVFNNTRYTLAELQRDLDREAIESAIDELAASHRIELYGAGASGMVAIDAQHKLFRLGIPCVAYTDPHYQAMAAAGLDPGDALLLFSHTGRTRDLICAAELAAEAGARTIAVTQAGSLLAQAVDLTIPAAVPEDTDIYTPMVSRIAHLAVVDVLVTGIAIRGGTDVLSHLERTKRGLERLRASKAGGDQARASFSESE